MYVSAGDVRRVSKTHQSALQNVKRKKKNNANNLFVLVNHLKTLGSNIVTLAVAHLRGTRVRTLLSAHVIPTDINVSAYRSLINVQIFVKHML